MARPTPLLSPSLLLGLPAEVRARRELGALLYGTLAAHDRLEALEPEARRRSRQAYLGTVSRNARLLELAARLLDRAAAQGLTLLPLKGALLAERYGDPGLRPMVDVDLLVAPAALDAASRLFEAEGLRRAFPPRARYTPRHGHDVCFLVPDDPELVVELHHRVHHELGVAWGAAPILARARPRAVLGAHRPAPDPVDHLWIVLAHAASHAFGDQPQWIFDAALLLEEAGGTDALSLALARAEAAGLGPACRTALRIGAALLPSALPSPPIAEGAAPAEAARAVAVRALLGPSPLARAPSHARSLLVRAALTGRPLDAVREVARKAGLWATELGERLG